MKQVTGSLNTENGNGINHIKESQIKKTILVTGNFMKNDKVLKGKQS